MPTLKSLVDADATREQIEEWCRRQTQVASAGPERNLCRVLGKYLMYVSTSDSAIAPHLELNGIWEPWITMAIARHIKPGMRCCDIGACYGYYSVLMADLAGAGGYVEAWEPSSIQSVRANHSINGLPVVAREQAAGPRGEVVVTLERRGDLGMGNIGGASVRSPLPNDSRFVRRVIQAEPEGEFDFIKIDTEGYEAEVWTALACVREVSPELTVCMEFTPGKHADPEAFLRRIMDDGFEVGSVDSDGMPRTCTIPTALTPDTGNFRMLWLTRST
jgi:FkbM family methyltransferase